MLAERITLATSLMQPSWQPRGIKLAAHELQPQNLAVDPLVCLAENIEHDVNVAAVRVEPALHGVHGYFCGLTLREAENASADAAERDRAQSLGSSGIEAARIARCELSAVRVGGISVCDGAYGVNDVPGR